jgi:4-alpha-glucanotransferase
MPFPRSSGLLLHPTSLPGDNGIGELGPSAFAFVDFLVSARQRLWQILPLGPTGFGDSPYQCFSAFAGNHLLISLEKVAQDGYLADPSLGHASSSSVDFGFVVHAKTQLLREAFQTFTEKATPDHRRLFDAFIANPRHRAWLDDYALFRALKDSHGGAAWPSWEPELVRRTPEALEMARRQLHTDINFHKWLQYVFFRQWRDLKGYANQNGIAIVGDIPIFVSHDSADVWANPELFLLDDRGYPTVVAGVPPDYFSATGQLWGNPLYRWDQLINTRFQWWVERFRLTLGLVDIVRLDHFRGFDACWSVPATEPTAVNGQWVKVPGEHLFKTLHTRLGRVPIIAENLGVITEAVENLRHAYKFPGMRILQFGYECQPDSVDLPHNFDINTVVYTGTHDNDTTQGWYTRVGQPTRDRLSNYVGHAVSDAAWELIRVGMASTGDLFLAPVQDILSLGNEARMNSPGQPSGNWCWRVGPNALTPELARRLADMVQLYNREG